MPVSPPPSAKLLVHGTIMDFYAWQQPLFDGSTGTFECVTRADSAVAIPFLERNKILLTRQWQPHKDLPFIDFPGGRIDLGEDMQTGVLRELQEEVGLQATHILEWHRHALKGWTRFEEGIYLVAGLTDGFPMHHDAGEKIESFTVTWSELVDLCLRGELRQSAIMLAILQMEFDPASKARLSTWLDTCFLHKN